MCASEWGKRELGWSLAPMTGISASEHTFACVYSEDDSCDVNQIDVDRRGDDRMNDVFHISACESDIVLVVRSIENTEGIYMMM